MTKSRIEAFTDAVIAIVMTLLVLELHQPEGANWAAFGAVGHKLVIYVISFISLAIYWNNHHHLFQLVKKIDGWVLWANNLLIFAMTLFPFVTAWVGDHLSAWAPQALFGLVFLGADVAYLLLGIALVRVNGKNSPVGQLFASYRKLYITIALNLLALLLGFLIRPELVIVVNTLMLLLWFIPEKQIERNLKN